MELKEYQAQTLAVLRRFFEEARLAGPKNAYETITRAPDQAARLGRYAGAYTPLARLPEVPYVCLRLPTGGGKTILAARAVAVARDAWIEKDHPLVLWLVPSNTIRVQTVQALKDPRHPYRQALDDSFSGRVRVLDVTDFTQLRPHDLRDRCCVVVGTIQTLRVTNTEGRKVYAHNEHLEPHFAGIPEAAPDLERLADGGIKHSFANLLHVHRPLMIVDEAHNAGTGLTREMQARVNPSAIVEFTATPRDRKGRRLNNILHSVSARELKAEAMIKLPTLLSEHDTWQGAVSGAIAEDVYRDQRRYRGRWKPRKHFLGADRVPAFDGVDDGEEVRCAQALDSLPGLECWIRNAARDPASFWLPTAAGRFYPDFVARLDDGRLLVVEYKGAHIADGPETTEKRVVGALWERESAGKCLFLMAEKTVAGKDVRGQLMEKVGA